MTVTVVAPGLGAPGQVCTGGHILGGIIFLGGCCLWGNCVTKGVTSLGQSHLWGSHISGDHRRSLGMGTVAGQQHLGHVMLRAAEQTVLKEKCWPPSHGR